MDVNKDANAVGGSNQALKKTSQQQVYPIFYNESDESLA